MACSMVRRDAASNVQVTVFGPGAVTAVGRLASSNAYVITPVASVMDVRLPASSNTSVTRVRARPLVANQQLPGPRGE